MTKKQLLKKLEKVDDNTEIILSSDPEGNNYSRLYDVCDEIDLKYFQRKNGELEFVDESNIGDNISEARYERLKSCIVFYPEL